MKTGTKEGEICNRDDCTGVIEFDSSLPCSCHISAPCSACETAPLVCPECGVSEHDSFWLEETPE